jgi:hypothetical protein
MPCLFARKARPPSAAHQGAGRAEMLVVRLAVVEDVAAEAGLTELRIVGGQVCGTKRFNYTTGVVVGLGPMSYGRRYCYEHEADARAALGGREAGGRPPGLWIKRNGAGIEFLNPAFCESS